MRCKIDKSEPDYNKSFSSSIQYPLTMVSTADIQHLLQTLSKTTTTQEKMTEPPIRLDKLPTEVLGCIGPQLDTKDLKAIARVCQRLSYHASAVL